MLIQGVAVAGSTIVVLLSLRNWMLAYLKTLKVIAL